MSEGSGQNIFAIRDGVIRTPPVSGSVLPGITRDVILTLARDLGFPVHEQPIPREMLYIADEVFFTGTAAEVTPIRELDGRAIGEGKRGPITEKLQTIYFDLVRGKLEKYNHWLSPVA